MANQIETVVQTISKKTKKRQKTCNPIYDIFYSELYQDQKAYLTFIQTASVNYLFTEYYRNMQVVVFGKIQTDSFSEVSRRYDRELAIWKAKTIVEILNNKQVLLLLSEEQKIELSIISKIVSE